MANILKKIIQAGYRGRDGLRGFRKVWRGGKRILRRYKLKVKYSYVFRAENMFRHGKAETVADLKTQYCTGCTACFNACPKQAISMREDADGFISSFVDMELCVHCGKCVQVCPVIHVPKGNRKPRTCYAVQNTNEVREKSTSGGAFSLIADAVLAEHGYICGATLDDNFEVHHVIVSDAEGVARQRKSKYVQSDLGGVFSDIHDLLRNGEKVLFAGCPCQVAGLKKYLGKPWDNLLLVDLVCHGGIAGRTFRKYIGEEYQGDIREFQFRTKDYGYMAYVHKAIRNDGEASYSVFPADSFQICMHSGLGAKMICAECPFAGFPRQGDITIGDFWGLGAYKPAREEFGDGKGTSVMILNNKKGDSYFSRFSGNASKLMKVPLPVATLSNRFAQHVERPNGHEAFQTMVRTQSFDKSVRYAIRQKYDVGILGVWAGRNYGSQMTYYALYTLITSLGLSALMIDLRSKRKSRDGSTKRMRAFVEKHYQHNIRERTGMFPRVPELNGLADTFICGSDQLWNYFIARSVGWGYFMDFVEDGKRKIAYATSFGHGKFFGDARVKGVAKYYLDRFDAISVREDSGVDILKNTFNIEGTQVLDPVFMVDPKIYEELTEELNMPPRKDYIAAYILDPTPEKQRALLDASQKLNCELVIMLDGDGGTQRWIKNRLAVNITGVVNGLNATQWVYYFQHAKYVITDSCHGASFAIIFHKPFVAISNSGRGSVRFNSLMTLFGLTDRLVEDPLEIIEHSDQYLSDIDYDAVDVIMQRERARSRQWLKDALAIPKPGLPNIEL